MEPTYIDDLDLSVRAYNSLKKAGIITLQAIQALSDEEIKALKYMNRKVFTEIKSFQLREMKIAHAFRHLNQDEMISYFEYCEQLPDEMQYDKRFMTDGESVYIVHFDSKHKIMDKHFCAKLKYIEPYEIQGIPSTLN